MEEIERYFPDLSETKRKQFAALYDLYVDWNAKINVISRKDIENLYLHHVLHSLAIAKVIPFTPGTSIVDIGCGGGFPSIPLAILFPETKFKLIDSINKKLKVAAGVAASIGLTNVEVKHTRMEDEKGKFDFAVSRAAMSLPALFNTCRKNIKKEQRNALPNGLICLKGGDLEAEMKEHQKDISVFELSDFFKEDFFTTKKAIYMPIYNKK